MPSLTASVPPPAVKSAPSEVRLVPWDPDSPAHVQRMIEQRRACGWKEELVPSWTASQREGRMALQWVVLSDNDANRVAKEGTHCMAHPKERSPLLDTAASLINKPRTPTHVSFLPIGHIGLNTQYETAEHDEAIAGLYWISNFYISGALQGRGLGRAAMDAVERTAMAEPLNAKVLALSSVTRENGDDVEKWKALGRAPPVIANQDWYERRGYVVYKRVKDLWWEADANGRLWPHSAVFMRKVIG